jgi:MFS family permease
MGKDFKTFNLSILLISATLTVMAGSIISPIINLMASELQIDAAQAGTIITMHSLFIALFSPLFGILIDKIGTKKIYIAGLILFGISGGMGLILESYWSLIVSRIFLGIGLAAFYNSITVMILHFYEGIKKNRVMGWRASSNSVGGVIWPFIGGTLGTLSWHFPFGVYLVGIPLGLIALITFPDVPQNKIDREELIEGKIIEIFKNDPFVLLLYFFMFITNLLLYSIVIFLPPKLENIGIISPFFIGIFLSLMTVAAGTISLIYEKIKASFSYEKILIIAFSIWISGFFLLFIFELVPIVIIGIMFFGIGQGMMIPTLMLWTGEKSPDEYKGRITSYLGTFGFLGQFSNPILFSPVNNLWGYNGIFIFSAFTSLFCLIVITFKIFKS